jgi:predicted GNAT family acetyltransferase
MEVQWPHRLADWKFASQLGEGFVAEDGGKLVGTALYWKYGSSHATLGLVVVSPDEQGRGVGRRLLELVLDELGERVTFLYATQAGLPLYEKLGFRECGMLAQHNGLVEPTQAIALPEGERLRELTQADIPYLMDMASQASGLDRREVLSALLSIAQGGVVLEGPGGILGFSLFRAFGRGYAIGPVVAKDGVGKARAMALISHWLAANEKAFVRIDVPDGTGLNDWLEQLGLDRRSTVVKMARNAGLEQAADTPEAGYRAYGIINQAMG